MTPSVRPLLCRSPLYPNESLPSFLIRLALVNRYEYTPTQVMALCRQYLSVPDDMARPAKADTYYVLAALVGIDVQTLHAATVHRFAAVFTAPPYQASTIRLITGQNIPILENRVLCEHVWPESQAQFCPFCLKESGYHQLTWTPCVVTLCLKHGCLLIQSCPGCQRMLNIRAILQAKCLKCGFSLTEAPTKRVATNKFALFSQAVVQSWLGLGPAPVQTDYGLPDQPPLVLYHLLQELHGVVANGAQHWQPRHRRNFSPAQRYHHYLTAFRGMVNWPQGFYDFLERYQQDLKHWPAQPTYPRWFDTLWLAPAFQFVQDAFDQYLLDHYSPLFLLRLQRVQANFTFRLKLPCLSEADAAKLLNTSPAVVRRLVRTGYLAPYSTTEDETLAQHLNLVSHAEVLKLQQQWSQTVPVNHVAQLLGTTSVIIRDLVKGGVLDIGFPLSQEDRNPEGISWTSLTTFTDSLQRTVRPHPATALSLRTLQGVVQQVAASGASSALIIQRILGKELRSYWPQQEYRLDYLEIPCLDVESLLDGLRINTPWLAPVQVANMMRVKETTIQLWIELGLLPVVAERNQTLCLDRAQVFSFINTHVFFEDVTARLGLRKCIVRRWLENGQVLPVSGPEMVERSRYLFKRADLERLKEESLLG